MDTGDLGVYVRCRNIDQLGYEVVFLLSGSEKADFSILHVLDCYTRSLGLAGTDVMFPRFRRGRRGVAMLVSDKSFYRNLRFSAIFQLDMLYMHIGWIGFVTEFVEARILLE